MTAEPRHPLIPPREVDPQQELPALELEVLARWRERDVFKESLRAREGAPRWVFYEGPPTANGPPGSHHVLSRVFKDIYPRFQTMRGKLVERKGGWDCHGLPVEIAVEQKLGIEHKSEIERYGIAEFNAQCRESVFEYLEEWDRLTERIGFWLDLEHAYRTLDETYMESVWWALAEIDKKGLLYEGHKVVPYCPRCETTLSSHEVALGYRDVVDPSVYVRLALNLTEGEQSGPLHGGDALLIWTTTPWTLPGNVAVAVGPDIEYVRARRPPSEHPTNQPTDETAYIVAAELAEHVLGEGAQILDRFPGAQLEGAHYRAPIFALSDQTQGGAPVIAGDFVTTDDGTGLVHIAPAFGEDDFRAAAEAHVGAMSPEDPHSIYNPVRPDGTYDQRVRSVNGEVSYEGRFVKDPALNEDLIADLDASGLLFKRADYEHSYPHCWRCGTPLIYYAKPSWYIATSKLREQLLAANETINWFPPHVKHGRFGDWLSNNVDWAISRERYWGTPLPVWRCANGHVHVVGSFTELESFSKKVLPDHHRPYVDEVEFPCPQCDQPMTRVPEVIDVWFDSGSMPFAQHHYPFENEEIFQRSFPADFICEAQDQTRGWFYSLLAVAALTGVGANADGAPPQGGTDSATAAPAPYRNVVCLGLILDGEGQKMSKSKGNAVEPWAVLDRYGADAFRWYFFTSKQPWDGYRFSQEAIAEGVRLFLKQLWSTYYFYVLYAHANEDALSGAPADADPHPTGPDEDLDRWALSRTAGTVELVSERLDAFDATSAGRAIASLVDELSNWYVRRSRRRFWDGDGAAFQTLRTCLLAVSKMLAPLCPFIADEIYDNLDGAMTSVHLCEFPTGAEIGERDEELERAMALARETVRLGLSARGKAKIKVRQPLGEAVVVAAGREREAIERLADVVREELNVRRVRFVAAAEELGRYEVKANYRTLGPLFGKDMPLAAEAIAALDPARVAEAVREDGANGTGSGGGIGIAVGEREHTLSAADVILSMRAPEGYSVEREGSHAVALDLQIDEDLGREGYAREIVHAVQNARKTAGLAVEDRIELWLAGAPTLIEATEAHRDHIAGETLAVLLAIGDDADASARADYREQTEVDGLELSIALRRS
jgi:isoleucyl-tRNA synthetase